MLALQDQSLELTARFKRFIPFCTDRKCTCDPIHVKTPQTPHRLGALSHVTDSFKCRAVQSLAFKFSIKRFPGVGGIFILLQWVTGWGRVGGGEYLLTSHFYLNFYSVEANTNYVEEIKLWVMKESFWPFVGWKRPTNLWREEKGNKKGFSQLFFFSDYLTFAPIWVAIHTFVFVCDKCCFSWTQTLWRKFFLPSQCWQRE